jgi:hypothetical protein
MLHNTILSESFVIEDNAKVVDYLTNLDSMTATGAILDGKGWENTAARVAFGGIPEDLADALKKLDDLEVDVRNHFKIPSKRPGGDRSKGTGFQLHKNFKAYKSTIKGALEAGVELLTAAGLPRPRSEVQNDIKEAKANVKTPEQKLAQATSTWLAIYANCDQNDPAA